MLAFDARRRYFCYRGAADMRKGFDALCGLVRQELEMDPLSGDVFIFFNRRKNQVKLLSWEQDGYGVYYKRLERGTYELPLKNQSQTGIRPELLQCILGGISVRHVTYKKRYIHAAEMCINTA